MAAARKKKSTCKSREIRHLSALYSRISPKGPYSDRKESSCSLSVAEPAPSSRTASDGGEVVYTLKEHISVHTTSLLRLLRTTASSESPFLNKNKDNKEEKKNYVAARTIGVMKLRFFLDVLGTMPLSLPTLASVCQ